MKIKAVFAEKLRKNENSIVSLNRFFREISGEFKIPAFVKMDFANFPGFFCIKTPFFGDSHENAKKRISKILNSEP